MDPFALGIEVGKTELDCALRLPNGEYRNKVVENDMAGFKALIEWLGKQEAGAVHVCIEATGRYWEEVAGHLTAQGMSVWVVDPVEIKAFGASLAITRARLIDARVVDPIEIKAFGAQWMARTKTYKVNARLIARFCFECRPEPLRAGSPDEQSLRAMLLRVDALQTLHTQEKQSS